MILPQPDGAAETHATAKFWLDVADEFVKFAALLIGAIWTYFTYRRGRTFAPRLEPEVSGHLLLKGEVRILSLICGAKNVGLSKVPIEQEGTVCQIYALTVDCPDPSNDAEPNDLISVFLDQDWIEPGETISEPHMLIVEFKTQDLIGIRIDLRMSSRGLVWTANYIVNVLNPQALNSIRNATGE